KKNGYAVDSSGKVAE
nr:RecName: Full=Insect toxin BmK AngP1 [Mesobuthus martensii]